MLLAKTGDASRRALILAGGGMRVAYQAGVLRALEQHGLGFSIVDGTSGGTMNASMLFSGLDPRQMCERWSSLNLMGFSSMMPLSAYKNPLKLKAMADADGIREKVFPHLGIDVSAINACELAEANYNLCNFSTKQCVSVSHREVLLEHLIAGISLPIFMPSVRIAQDDFTDAVWIKDANLWAAVEKGAEELWLVWCIGNTHDYKDGSFEQYVHMIEISACGGLLEEFARIKDLNQRIAAGDSPYGQNKPIRLHVIKPVFPLPLDPEFFFDRINASELIAIGYRNAKDYLSNCQPEGVALDWRASSMQEPGQQAVCRLLFEGKTQNRVLAYTLRVRAELNHCEQVTFTEESLSPDCFVDLSLDGKLSDMPSSTAVLDLGLNGSRLQAKFVTDDGHSYEVVLTIARTAWMWRLMGRMALIKVRFRYDEEDYDEDTWHLSRWQGWRSKAKFQLRNSPGLLRRWKIRKALYKRLY